MKLNDIDTRKFLVDPKSDTFIEDMVARSPVFDLKINRVNTRKALTYICLVYDKESYFRRNVKEYVARKYKAGIVANFSIQEDNMFAREVEKIILGENESFNKAVIQYVAMQYDVEYARLVVYEHNYYKFLEKSYRDMDSKGELKKRVDELANDIESLEVKVFGGNEVQDMRKALYEGTAMTRLKLRIEDQVDEYQFNGLKDISPWGHEYFIEPLTFVGDKIPTDDA